ncbi:unnamed protein product [Allacma fusca]|uniref:Alpha,alpha-trehalose glucohydrolase n=1 Tax=Allacma fusca TaxID=39272 RepID=A0A8J2LIL4_9HEXA|nr:unnamed protein product [Allacma fusca]
MSRPTKNNMLKYQAVVAWIFLSAAANQDPFLPCDNDIYCYGDILHTVQRSLIFKDSKTFVDMKLRYEPSVVRSNYQFLIDKYGPHPPKDKVEAFVEHNFNAPGFEFEPWEPQDWTDNPAFLKGIDNQDLRKWASELNAFWKQLGRHIRKDVESSKDRYSMIYVDNPVIVPGGRFMEFYYWDQFWILKGLLHCEMTETVRGMLENFFQMVQTLGYIPNGGRIYYKRSHPPLLIPMVKDYVDHTKNSSFLQNNIHTLDKEFDFWMQHRTYNLTVAGNNYTVVRYNVEVGRPRPEAYNPDYDLASGLDDPVAQTELFMHLKTAAESGLDFSSRWFVPDNDSTVGVLRDSKTRFVIPVDLNVLILRNAKLMQGFHNQLGNTNKSQYYSDIAKLWETTINSVFWNDTEGSWFDYVDIENHIGHKTEFYPGNVLPLILNLPSMTKKTPQVINYLEQVGVLTFPGGIPSSLEQTGEQWDFPNAWAPHVHWFIESLEASGHRYGKKLAALTAQKWISNNYLTYRTHRNTMFEKYDAVNVGSAGGGGEYDVVIGFGWSNGVILDLLHKYGSSLKAPNLFSNGSTNLLLAAEILVMSVCLSFCVSRI